MSDKEHKAMAWLDGVASDRITIIRVVDSEYARTLKAMLSRPVLPEEPSEEALKAIWNGERTPGPIYRRLYVHLTAPKTKTVWTVSHCHASDAGTGGVETFDKWPNATAEVSRLVEQGMMVAVSRREVHA